MFGERESREKWAPTLEERPLAAPERVSKHSFGQFGVFLQPMSESVASEEKALPSGKPWVCIQLFLLFFFYLYKPLICSVMLYRRRACIYVCVRFSLTLIQRCPQLWKQQCSDARTPETTKPTSSVGWGGGGGQTAADDRRTSRWFLISPRWNPFDLVSKLPNHFKWRHFGSHERVAGTCRRCELGGETAPLSWESLAVMCGAGISFLFLIFTKGVSCFCCLGRSSSLFFLPRSRFIMYWWCADVFYKVNGDEEG